MEYRHAKKALQAAKKRNKSEAFWELLETLEEDPRERELGESCTHELHR